MTGPAAAEAGEDEFAWLGEVADELGIDRARIPPVTRRSLKTDAGRQLSAVVWGQDEPELIFLHGGGQNAHTWDLVALLLGRPAIAIDLPGHGHSSWRDDRDYGPGPQCRGSRRGDRPARGPVRGCGGDVARRTDYDPPRRDPPGSGPSRRLGRRYSRLAVRGGSHDRPAARRCRADPRPAQLRQPDGDGRRRRPCLTPPSRLRGAPWRRAQQPAAARWHLGLALRPA